MKRTFVILVSILLLAVSSVACGGEIGEGDLRISEIMASNQTTIEDVFGLYSDWVEIHNTGDEPLSLKGVCISDKWQQLNRFMFPDDAVIQPDEYIVVFASGVKLNIVEQYHMPFKLKTTGESVILTCDGVLLDAVTFADQESDVGYALGEDGEYHSTITPTPGMKNSIN